MQEALVDAEVEVKWEINVSFQVWPKDVRRVLELRDAFKNVAKKNPQALRIKGGLPSIVAEHAPEDQTRMRTMGNLQRGVERAFDLKGIDYAAADIGAQYWAPWTCKVKVNGDWNRLGFVNSMGIFEADSKDKIPGLDMDAEGILALGEQR